MIVMTILVMMILVMVMTMVTRDLEKHIIAQSVNTGHDVSNIQFDLQVMTVMIMRMRRRKIMMGVCPVLVFL